MLTLSITNMKIFQFFPKVIKVASLTSINRNENIVIMFVSHAKNVLVLSYLSHFYC